MFYTSLIHFILSFLKEKKKAAFALVLCSFVFGACNAIEPFMLKNVIDGTLRYEGNLSKIFSHLSPALISFCIVAVMTDASIRCGEAISFRTLPIVKARMRSTMFSYMIKHSQKFFGDNLAGKLSNKILDMARGMDTLWFSTIYVLIPISAQVLFSLGLLCYVNWHFALLASIWLFLFLGCTIYCIQGIIQVSDIHAQENSNLSGKIVDSYRNASVVRFFSRRHYELSYMESTQKQEVKKSLKMGRYMWRVHLFQGICSTLFSIASLLLFVYGWQRGFLTIGDFSFVTMTTLQLIMVCWWTSEVLVQCFRDWGVCRQAFAALQEPHDVVDVEGAKPILIEKGNIVFENVSFHYVFGKDIFKDKNLEIEAGQKVGLVGFSGAGKTTFANLLMRFYDLEEGRILIDGQDISRVTQDSLREQISFIPQDCSLFHRTLLENIAYGKPEATREEVMEAAKKAHAHSFIEELEEGYNTLVGEGGIKLSGGQRQRIAIARAFLKDSSLLLLDEATSALDTLTERKIQSSLEKLMQTKTCIVIAHRLSTLANMDKILVFKNGRIIESGSQKELLAMNGHFAMLWGIQNDGYLPDKPL